VRFKDDGILCVGPDDYATFLYQPVTSGVSVHNYIPPPSFLNASGGLTNTIPCSGLSAATITLELESDPSKTYKVIVQPSGEVNEQK